MKKYHKVKRNSKLIARMIESEYTILNPTSGKLYQLNQTASFIWKLLWHPLTCDEITKKISDKFDYPTDKIKRDVSDFIALSLINELLKAT